MAFLPDTLRDEMVQSVFNFFVEYHNLQDMDLLWTVDISLTKEQAMLDSYTDGSFVVIVPNTKDIHQLATLMAHEFIHAKQHFERRLIKIGKLVIWENTVMVETRETIEEYCNQPWEIEAYTGEENDARKCLKAILH